MANITTPLFGGSSGVAQGNQERNIQRFSVKIEDLVADGLATTEYARIFTIPAGTILNVLNVKNSTALSMGTSPAISLGDSSSATLFVNAASTVTDEAHHTIATATKTYPTANDLRLTLTGGTLASGTLSFTVELIDVSDNAYPASAAAV